MEKRHFRQVCHFILQYQMWLLCWNTSQPRHCSWGPDPYNRPHCTINMFACNIDAFRRTCCCLLDWPPATVSSFPVWLPACHPSVINGRQFQGSLPRRSARAVWCQSLSDCRVMNCGDRKQAISMQRCVPPDRSIQGPPLVTQLVLPYCHSSWTLEGPVFRDHGCK